MEEEIENFIEVLEDLKEDLPLKLKESLESIILEFKKPLNVESLLSIQDRLEFFSNNKNLDSFSRNEIINIITDIETLI